MHSQHYSYLINNSSELVRFSPYHVTSKRKLFDLTQTHGLNENGDFSEDFIPFREGSIEKLMLDVIQTGNVTLLTDQQMILAERPQKNSASRSLSVFDPATGMYYTLGGIGAISPTRKDHRTFELCDPRPDILYRDFCRKQKVDSGGTRYVTDAGFIEVDNPSLLGIFPYNDPVRGLVRKANLTTQMCKSGMSSPQYIAIGTINNVADGWAGFSIYRSFLTPEYLLNCNLWWDEQGQLKPHYFQYLHSKYQQIQRMHFEFGHTHGQLSNTNTLAEIVPTEKTGGRSNHFIRCQIKDFDTYRPLPTSRFKSIQDGLCIVNIGMTVLKSPLVAALINDMQLALTQEFNSLYIPIRMAQHRKDKIAYIRAQAPRIIHAALKSYGFNTEQEIFQTINFSMDITLKKLSEKVVEPEQFSLILGGVAAHAMFGMSERSASQIELIQAKPVIKSKRAIESYAD